jgi:hypothetical protein
MNVLRRFGRGHRVLSLPTVGGRPRPLDDFRNPIILGLATTDEPFSRDELVHSHDLLTLE